jgi:hypothetical protein
MAETSDVSIWVTVGSAIGGLFAGVGSVLGINKMRTLEPVKNGEGTVSRQELDTVRAELAQAKITIAEHGVFIDTVKQIHDSLKRIHERIDGLDTKLARMEGFDAGRKSMEHG